MQVALFTWHPLQQRLQPTSKIPRDPSQRNFLGLALQMMSVYWCSCNYIVEHKLQPRNRCSRLDNGDERVAETGLIIRPPKQAFSCTRITAAA